MKHQAGFSLIETLVALIVVSIAIAGSAQLLDQSVKGLAQTRATSEVIRLVDSHFNRLSVSPVSVGNSTGQYSAELHWELSLSAIPSDAIPNAQKFSAKATPLLGKLRVTDQATQHQWTFSNVFLMTSATKAPNLIEQADAEIR